MAEHGEATQGFSLTKLKKSLTSKKLDPTYPNYASTVLEILENGDVSEIEDLNSDEEDLVDTPVLIRNPQRYIGKDATSRTEEQMEEEEDLEEETAEKENFEEGIGEEAEDNEINNYIHLLTHKKEIKYRRRPFKIPDIEFDSPHIEFENLELLSPYHYFKKYIPDSLFEQMANFTNIYALQKNKTGFKNTDSTEIQVLFALHIIMGCLNKFPRVRMYWNSTLGMEVFLRNMTRDRFYDLRTCLHLVNNLDRPAGCNDKLYKVRPLLDSVRRRCLELPVEEFLCVDEQMVPFTGKLSIKQYVKGKPQPWGIKIFVLCGKSGIAYDFMPYQGKATGLSDSNVKYFGLGASVVLASICTNAQSHILQLHNMLE